ncbi:MAG: hypothetical protein ACYDEV_15070 [Acidiferrobacter sp.]
MKIDCPLCQGHRTERLALTYAKGVTHTVSNSVGVGAGGGGGGGLMSLLFPLFLPLSIPFFALKFLGVGVFGMRTWTRSSTLLAAESQPPKRLSYFKVFLMAVAYFLAVPVLIGYLGIQVLQPITAHAARVPVEIFFGILILVAVFGGLFLGIRGARAWNNVIWAPKEAGWQRSFLCQRCGAHFLVPDYDPIGVNVVRSDKAGTGEYLPRAETPEQRAAVIAKAQSDHRMLRKKGA